MNQLRTPSYTRWCGWFPAIGSAVLLVKPYLGQWAEWAYLFGYSLLFLFYLVTYLFSAHPYTNSSLFDAPPGGPEDEDEKTG